MVGSFALLSHLWKWLQTFRGSDKIKIFKNFRDFQNCTKLKNQVKKHIYEASATQHKRFAHTDLLRWRLIGYMFLVLSCRGNLVNSEPTKCAVWYYECQIFPALGLFVCTTDQIFIYSLTLDILGSPFLPKQSQICKENWHRTPRSNV